MTAGDDRHRLETAEKQLALVHSYIPRIDSKVSAMFAIMSAEVAIATANLRTPHAYEWYIAVPMAVFFLMAAAVYWNLYRCAFPHLEGGSNSLVYFGEIAKLSEVEYIEKFTEISVADLTTDMCSQIWQVSGIATKKFGYLKIATQLAIWSALPWAILLVASAVVDKKMPVADAMAALGAGALISQPD